MTLQNWFWAIYVLSLLFFGFGYWRDDAPNRWRWGGWIIVWVLIGILGWKLFGSPIKG